jgi:hypothetical protein
MLAKLSTALTVSFGPVLDSTGAEYTGAAVGDIKICKGNGTPGALNGSATLTHKEVGMYELVLTTSDISQVGPITVQLSKTTYAAPPVRIDVLPALVYDSLVAGSDALQVDTIQVSGTAQTARDIGLSVLLSAGTGTGQLDFTSGVVKANLAQILGAAVTGTAAYLVASFTKWFNIAVPTGTVNSLPDAVAGATGGVAIVGSVMGKSPATLAAADVSGNVAADLQTIKTRAVTDPGAGVAIGTAVAQVGSNMGSASSVTGDVAGKVLGGGSGTITGVGVWGDLRSILGTVLTETSGYLAAAFKKFFNVLNPTATTLSLPDAAPGASGGLPTTNGTKVNQTVDLTTGQTIAATVAGAVGSVTGDVGGKVLGSGASAITGIGARVVDATGNAVAPASLLPAALVGGRIDASMGAVAAGAIDAAAIATGAIDADALAADAGTEIAAAVHQRQMTESYAADGVAPTHEQCMFMVMQFLHEMGYAGTTGTVKKLNGTTAMTFTIDDAVTPTSITRAS